MNETYTLDQESTLWRRGWDVIQTLLASNCENYLFFEETSQLKAV